MQFASQIRNGLEDATSDDVPFDPGDPKLNLIEPRRVSGSEVEVDPGILLQEVANQRGLVG